MSRDDLQPQAAWPPYGVGDLVDAARRAAELIGSSAEVTGIAVAPPPEGSDTPTVRVVLDNLEQSEEIRARLTEQEMLPHFIRTQLAGTWAAEGDDLVLRVTCVEKEAI